MKKLSVIFLILFLILFTALIKNSTKRVDDQIFATKENIRDLKKNLENIKLEHDYLSSAEKLLKFQDQYFDDELVKRYIQNIKVINITKDGLLINQFSINNE
tara:strand:+ start:817 stop:1122 length:306 start_codon:yes stop_codon:yes gene_type:complete